VSPTLVVGATVEVPSVVPAVSVAEPLPSSLHAVRARPATNNGTNIEVIDFAQFMAISRLKLAPNT
jgi:hypothetical protein